MGSGIAIANSILIFDMRITHHDSPIEELIE